MRAFGEVAKTGMEDRLGFPGQLDSAETGLYYNYFRDYEPGTGRYVQSDPIGLRDDTNVYTYVGNQATSFVDPNGLSRVSPRWPDPDYSDSCKVCDFSIEDIKDSVNRACEQAMKDIRNERLKNCIRERCAKGKVVCYREHKYCDEGDHEGNLGWYQRGTINQHGHAHICVNNHSEAGEIGQTAVHEWCHSCDPELSHGPRDPTLEVNLRWRRSGCPL